MKQEEEADENNSKGVVKNFAERNEGTKRKSPKTVLTSAYDPNIMPPNGLDASYHRSN